MMKVSNFLNKWSALIFVAMFTFFMYSCNDDDDDDDDDVNVTGVTLEESTLTLTVNLTDTLTVVVEPTVASNSSVNWSSSDETVATVVDGIVTAIAEGSATITVTSVDGGYTNTCIVTVAALSNSYSQSSGDVSVSEMVYSSTTSDENAVNVSGGTFLMSHCVLTKTGETLDSDGSSFYGSNAALLATDNGVVNMTGGSITTDAIGANAIVAYGGTVNVSDVVMNCTQSLSRGIHATGGGTIVASNLTITTAGANSSVIATDRGGGTVTVTGGTYTCTGTDCAVLYSTGDIIANNITGSSAIGEIGAIEGDNTITINNCDLTSGATSTSRGLFLYQSFSGDAGEGVNSTIDVTGGSLTMTDDAAPLIEVATVVTGQVTLDGVTTTVPSGIIMYVDYNTRWETYGATGVLILSGDGTTYKGSIVSDSYSSAVATVNAGVIWQGAYNTDDTAKATTLTVNGGTWELTGNSNVDSITLTNGGVINKNGYTLAYTTLTDTSGTIND